MSFASFNPETFTSGGITEGEVTIAKALFEERVSDEFGASIVLVVTLADADEAEHLKFYNVGKSQFVQVANDGRSIESVDESKTYVLSNKSGAGKFFMALRDAGFPMSRLDKGDVTVLEGTKMVIETRASGTKKRDGSDGTITVPVKVIGGQSVAKVGATKPKAAAGSAASSGNGKAAKGEAAELEAAEDGDAEAGADPKSKAVDIVTEILIAAEGPITVKEVQSEIFTRMRKDPDKAEVMKLASNAEFLGENWNYDTRKKLVSIG